MSKFNPYNTYNPDIKTEATPLIIDLKQFIVNRWAEATREVTEYKGYSLLGSDSYDYLVKKAIFRLFVVLRSSIKKELAPEEYTEMYDDLNNNRTPVSKYIDHFYFMDELLYNKGLTKFDGKQKYDRSNAEASNQHKGY